MDARHLIRWSGMTLSVGGVLWLSAIFHPPDTLQGMLSPAWASSHYVTALASLVLVFGLIGLYASQAARTGWLGLVAFILTLSATAMLTATEVLSGALAPHLAASPATQSLVDPQQAGPFVITIAAIAILDIVGNILLGIAIMIAKALSPWASLLIIAGFALLAVGVLPPGLRLLAHLGIAMSALGYAWYGYAVWTAMATAPLAPPR